MYDNYIQFLKTILSINDIEWFKSSRYYRDILEHCDYSTGLFYYNKIIDETNISDKEIADFSHMNDKLGNPLREFYNIGLLSPTNFRYVYHSHLILTHLKSLGQTNPEIVEVGGGYGGLYLALKFFSKQYDINIKEYTIIDLTEPLELTKRYLQYHNVSSVNLVDAKTFGADIIGDNKFLISNYCFSEISSELQAKYKELLFPKISHGFLVWNHIPLYDFGFQYKSVDEIPNISKFIYF